MATIPPAGRIADPQWQRTHDGQVNACGGVDRVARVATSAAMMQAFAAAAELGVAETLTAGPMHIATLARRLECDRESLRRLLRSLCAVGFCEERESDVFAATSAGCVLQQANDRSLHNWILWFASYLWPEWAQLATTVRTGRSGRSLTRDTKGMEHLERDAEAARIFDGAMGELTRLVAESVATHHALSGARTIVDIGGGSGELLCSILKRHTRVHGILFDRPHAIERARETVRAAGAASRCELVTGNFFESVPQQGDVYILKSVIHDWNDDASQTILRHCRHAMNPAGRILLVEHIMPERLTCSIEHQDIARRDLTMLIGPGGRERTEREFRDLLAPCALACRTITQAAMGFHVIEAECTQSTSDRTNR